MKVLLDSLHLNVHMQEFYPNKLQPHKIKSKPVSGSERVNTICIIIQNLMIHFKTFFRQIVFIATNII